MQRVLDTHISYLLPFIGLQLDYYNVQEMISNIRILQTSLENKLHTFYLNLSEREQSKVILRLPQFQNSSFLNAVNRSVNNSINQGMKNNSFLEKCTSKTATEPKVVVDSSALLSQKIRRLLSRILGYLKSKRLEYHKL